MLQTDYLSSPYIGTQAPELEPAALVSGDISGLILGLRPANEIRRYNFRADSRFAPNQCETTLLCNDVSHWLGANLDSTLYLLSPDPQVDLIGFSLLDHQDEITTAENGLQ